VGAGGGGNAEIVGEGEGGVMFLFYYAWKNNSKRTAMYRRACRVLARGSLNSCLVEFENGQREIVSRNAIRIRSKKPPVRGLLL